MNLITFDEAAARFPLPLNKRAFQRLAPIPAVKFSPKGRRYYDEEAFRRWLDEALAPVTA